MATDRTTILTAYQALEDAAAAVAGFDYTGLSVAELLELLSRREVLARSAPVVDHMLLAALQTRTTPQRSGRKAGPMCWGSGYMFPVRRPSAGSAMPPIWDPAGR